MIGLVIFAALGWIVAILCNFLWYKLAEDQSEGWSKYCEDLINRFYGKED